MAVHMFNKQNKTSLSEYWNEYRNGQGCNGTSSVTALTAVSFRYSPDRYDTRSNIQTTMYILYIIKQMCCYRSCKYHLL